MRIAQKVAGYSLGRADILRKAMGKKKREVLEKEFEGFREGMKANGFSGRGRQGAVGHDAPVRRLRVQQVARRRLRPGVLLDRLPEGELSRPSTWPACSPRSATTRTRPRSTWPTAAGWASRCCRPTSTSRRRTSPRWAPTSASASVRSATSARTSLPRWSIRVPRRASSPTSPTTSTRSTSVACNKKVTESLVKAGAFDSLGHPRKGLFLVHTDAVDSVLGTKKAEAMGQFDLFGGADSDDCGDSVFTIKVPDRGVGGQAQARPRAGDAGALRVRSPAQRGRASARRSGRHRRSRRSWTETSPTRRRSGSAGSSRR